jgi:hypothetical protein
VNRIRSNNAARRPSVVFNGDSKWSGGVLSPQGKIYGVPMNSDKVLRIGDEASCVTACPAGSRLIEQTTTGDSSTRLLGPSPTKGVMRLMTPHSPTPYTCTPTAFLAPPKEQTTALSACSGPPQTQKRMILLERTYDIIERIQ